MILGWFCKHQKPQRSQRCFYTCFGGPGQKPPNPKRAFLLWDGFQGPAAPKIPKMFLVLVLEALGSKNYQIPKELFVFPGWFSRTSCPKIPKMFLILVWRPWAQKPPNPQRAFYTSGMVFKDQLPQRSQRCF